MSTVADFDWRAAARTAREATKLHCQFMAAFMQFVPWPVKTACILGVFRGQTARALKAANPSLHLTLIDAWRPLDPVGYIQKRRRTLEDWDTVYAEVCREFAGERIIRLTTEDAAEVVDGPFDLIFIDADHRFKAVYRDIELYLPKLARPGIFAGHDIRKAGVASAVDQLVGDDYAVGSEKTWLKVYDG